uniref:Tripartite motif-containing protein 2 n=1 Tax=Magallana gigas TaxID=29159 RepID=K1QYW0_MAGGI
MNSKYLTILLKQEAENELNISEIKRCMAHLKKLLDSNDISLISAYRSRNAEFRKLPPKVKVIFPQFTPHKINRDWIYQQFGSLSALHFTTEERIFKNQILAAESSPPDKPLIDEPFTVTTIPTDIDDLTNVAYLGDEKIWTSGQGNIMMLHNVHGELLESIQTKSGNWPEDIAVMKNGDLVYADYNESTVNIVKNNQIQTVVRLRRWRPLNVCGTSSGDLLVVMLSLDEEQTKIVRYSRYKATQVIQYNDQGKPLYSSGYSIKHISENNNQDICVSDNGACAVVVVNQTGKLRFRYTGSFHFDFEVNENEIFADAYFRNDFFTPAGITTDSQNRILTADLANKCIHVLDQDGQFLLYIFCDLFDPLGLSVGERDCLLVAECRPREVKKIQYCMQVNKMYMHF